MTAKRSGQYNGRNLDIYIDEDGEEWLTCSQAAEEYGGSKQRYHYAFSTSHCMSAYKPQSVLMLMARRVDIEQYLGIDRRKKSKATRAKRARSDSRRDKRSARKRKKKARRKR